MFILSLFPLITFRKTVQTQKEKLSGQMWNVHSQLKVRNVPQECFATGLSVLTVKTSWSPGFCCESVRGCVLGDGENILLHTSLCTSSNHHSKGESREFSKFQCLFQSVRVRVMNRLLCLTKCLLVMRCSALACASLTSGKTIGSSSGGGGTALAQWPSCPY